MGLEACRTLRTGSGEQAARPAHVGVVPRQPQCQSSKVPGCMSQRLRCLLPCLLGSLRPEANQGDT